MKNVQFACITVLGLSSYFINKGCKNRSHKAFSWRHRILLQLELCIISVCMLSAVTDPAILFCLTSSKVSSDSQQRNDTIMTSLSISASISPLLPFSSINTSFSPLPCSNILKLVWMGSLLPFCLSCCPFLSHFIPFCFSKDA